MSFRGFFVFSLFHGPEAWSPAERVRPYSQPFLAQAMGPYGQDLFSLVELPCYFCYKTAGEPEGSFGFHETGRLAMAKDQGEEFRENMFPRIDFTTFILSLNASALVHMGVVEDPGTGRRQPNRALAKQTIDILGMLEEKTRGNLKEEEERIFLHLLQDLRLRYVRGE